MPGESRLAGVGFLVGAKDDGATEVFDDTAESADRMADAAEQAGDRGSRGMDRLGRAIEGINAFNLANISSTLDDIAERAGLGVGAQATALESFGAQFGQTARAAEARLGSMSGAMAAHRQEVSSLAYTYGVSGDEMFAAMAPLSRLGVDINEVFGENSARALAGHLQAGIISGQAFGGVLAELVGVYELQADEAGNMVNSLTAIGDRFGFVAEIGQGLPAIMDAIRPVAARYPNIAEDVDGVATSIARLAAGMVNMGMAPEAALQAATQTFSSLSEQRDAFTDLVTGVSAEFPDMAQQIGISSGDIEGSIAAVMSSPVEFARNMGQLLGSMDEADPFAQRLAGTLRQISPELLNIVRNTAEGGDALAQATEPIEGVEDAFSRAGRAALTSTLTFADSLERMRDAHATRMNDIGRRLVPDFVKRQREAYRDVGDRMEHLAAQDGPMGALTRGFLRVRTFGLVQGLLPGLGALTAGLGDTAAAAGPVLAAMRDTGLTGAFSKAFQSAGKLTGASRLLGASFSWLGPVTLLAGAGYLLYRNWDRLSGMFDELADSLEKMASKFYNWARRIDWEDLGDQFISGILSLFTGMGQTAEDEAPSTGARIGMAMADMLETAAGMTVRFARGMWDRIVEWILDPPDIESQVSRGAAALGTSIGAALGVGMLTPLRGGIIRTFGRLFTGFGDIMTGGPGARLAGRGLRTLLRRIPYVGAILGVLFDLPDIIASFQTGGIVAGLRETFGSILNGLLLGIPQMIQEFTGTNIIDRVFDFLFEGLNIGNVMEAIEGGQIGRAILEGILGATGGGFSRMLWESIFGEGSMDEVMGAAGGALEGVGAIFMEVFRAIGDVYNQTVEPVWSAMQEAGGQIGDIFSQLWNDTLSPLFSDITGAFAGVFGGGGDADGIVSGFENAEASARGFAEVAGDWIRNNVTPAILWLADNVIPLVVRGVELFAAGVRAAVGFFRTAWPVVVEAFNRTRDVVMTVATAVWDFWEENVFPTIESIRNAWTNLMDAIVPAATSAFDVISGVITWWWENVTQPYLGALWSFWSWVVGRVVDYWEWAYNNISGVVTWWWENVTRPIFGFLLDFWTSVVGGIWSAGRSVFNFLSEYITNRINDAGDSFAVLGATWEGVKNVLAAGFRVIAAEVNRWLVVPFVRLQGTLTGMAEAVHLAFLRVKAGVLELFLSIMRGFQNMVRNLPGGDRLASFFAAPIASIEEKQREITGRGGEISRYEATIAQGRRRRQAEIDAANERARTAREGLAGAVGDVAGTAARVLLERRQERERARQAREEERQRNERMDRASEEEQARRAREARERRRAADQRREATQAAQEEERAAAAQTAQDARDERRTARAATDASRERERQERERQERRGRGARRAQARSGPTQQEMTEAMTEAIQSGPGSSSDNPTHVVIEQVANRAYRAGQSAAPTQPRYENL